MEDKIIWDWAAAGLERFTIIEDASLTIDVDLYSTNYELVSLDAMYLFMEDYCRRHEIKKAMTHVESNLYHFINGWDLTDRARKTLTGGFFRTI